MATANNSICSVETCERKAWSRGLCNGHYNRRAKTGSTFRPCPGCGNDLPLKHGIRYCSPDCAPNCVVEGCDRKADAGESCQAHHTRKFRYGSYSKKCEGCGKEIPVSSFAKRYCSDNCAPMCKSDGCLGRAVALGYCNSHNWRRKANGSDKRTCRKCGEPLALVKGNKFYCLGKCYEECSAEGCDRRIYRNKLCDAHFSQSLPNTPTWIGSLKPRDFSSGCKACGHALPLDNTSGFCGVACYSYWRDHGDEVQNTSRTCGRCGCAFSILDGPGKVRRPFSTKTCLACKARKTGYRKHGAALLSRSGSLCEICDGPIDPNLKFPEPLSLSIDHVIPWSQGGTDDLDNLRATHLICNSLRQARVDTAS